jgi:hypothetical protein
MVLNRELPRRQNATASAPSIGLREKFTGARFGLAGEEWYAHAYAKVRILRHSRRHDEKNSADDQSRQRRLFHAAPHSQFLSAPISPYARLSKHLVHCATVERELWNSVFYFRDVA